ncbi:MAG: trimethylamine methyltransferase family protein [Gammaproteobacteria bacterium]|nr:trimethylamine methyltransferase family protein [Gammaproteobacteria bacterium]
MALSRGRRSQRSHRSNQGINQLAKAPLVHPWAPVEALSPDQLDAVHEASIKILENLGISVLGSHAISLFEKHGAKVEQIDGNEALVKLTRRMIEAAVASSPERFVLNAPNPANNIEIGGNQIHFGLVSGPPNVHDCINGRRVGNFADYQTLIKLGQFFNAIDFFGNQAIAPTDLPVGTRHLDTALCNLTLADKPFLVTGIGAGRVLDAMQLMAIYHGKQLDELRDFPCVMTNINVNSPRKLDDAMAYSAMQMAYYGQPVVVTPFTLMGAMTPATLPAALAQQNAEALFGVVLTQLVRPGAQVVYGGFTSNVDMRSGAPAFGTPENSLANIAGGQLARRYGLPYRTSACNAANVVDAQAAYETQMAMWGATLGHGNLIYHAAGWLEGGLVASFEKLVLDVEMIQHMKSMLAPRSFAAEEFGFDAMEEVGAGGHFFGCEHTMARYQTAFYSPILSDWQNHENWVMAGEKTATERATALWQHALAHYTPPSVSADIFDAMNAYVAKRKAALGSDEPNFVPDFIPAG